MSAIDRMISELIRKRPTPTYADYLQGAIVEQVLNLSDEKLLKYIHSMLMSAVTAEKQTGDC